MYNSQLYGYERQRGRSLPVLYSPARRCFGFNSTVNNGSLHSKCRACVTAFGHSLRSITYFSPCLANFVRIPRRLFLAARITRLTNRAYISCLAIFGQRQQPLPQAPVTLVALRGDKSPLIEFPSSHFHCITNSIFSEWQCAGSAVYIRLNVRIWISAHIFGHSMRVSAAITHIRRPSSTIQQREFIYWAVWVHLHFSTEVPSLCTRRVVLCNSPEFN